MGILIGPRTKSKRKAWWSTLIELRDSIAFMKEDPEKYGNCITKEEDLYKHFVKEFKEIKNEQEEEQEAA